MSVLIEQMVDGIIECCRRIVEAEPSTDEEAENELWRLGEVAFGLGYEPSMVQLCTAARDKAWAQGNRFNCGALCNNAWHGIGDWRR